MNGYVKKVYEFSDDKVEITESWKYTVEVDKENDSAEIKYYEIEKNNQMKLFQTFTIERAELVFKTIAKEFDK